MSEYNHYFDATHPLRPYTHSLPANPESFPPEDALRGEAPERAPGYWPCMAGGAWQQVEDYRGREGWVNGEPSTIADLGPLPDGWSDTPPPPTLAEVRARALETLRLKKWEAKNAGIRVNGIAIDTDDRGQATISGAVMNVMLDPAFTARWKTAAVDANGASVWVTLDGPMLVGLSKALTQYTEACFAVEAVKQAEVAALGSAAGIQAWLAENLDAGWPPQDITLVAGG